MLPGLLGFITFYLIPMVIIFYQSFINTTGSFVWFENYSSLFQSESFLLAMKNTAIYLLAGGGIAVLLAFLISWVLFNMQRNKIKGSASLKVSFLFPLIVPTGIIVLFTELLFASGGVINDWLGTNISWLNTSPYSFWVLVLLYVWKNFGYFVIIFFAAFERINSDTFEAARIDGAGSFSLLTKITLPQIKSSVFFVIIMSVIGVFKMNRESFLLYGDYPSDSAYMLQNFINNNLAKLNLSRVAAAAMVLFAAFAVLISYLIHVSERSDEI